jgi:hypothetical protein
MKNYLKELEISGVILMFIGCIMHRLWSLPVGIWACSIGMLFWLLVVIYKAFHWKEYQRENRMNIVIMLCVIALLWFLIIRMR